MSINLCAFADEASPSLDGQIAALKRNGISYVELRSVDGVNVKDLTAEQARQISDRLQAEGIFVWALGSPLGKVSIDIDFDEYAKTVEHLCALANIFCTDKLRVFSFFDAYEKREKVIEYLSKMIRIAASYGVKLYHENEKDVYGDTLARVLDLQANVPELKFVYDPANFLQVGESADRTLDALIDGSDYFHIKDVVAATGELVPAGEGDGKIAELIARLDRDVTFTIEPHLAVFDGYSMIDGTQMKHKFHFESSDQAFDCAVNAIKKLIEQNQTS